jgi:hypothetical protein
MGTLYQHFKGDYYLKLYEAEHSETGEILVIYISVKTGKVYARPKEMFYEIVKKEGYEGPRFKERNLNPNE